MAGAGMAVCGDVFGSGLASRERGLSSVRSVRMGGGIGGGGSSWVAWARLDDRLLRRLFPNRLRPLLLPPDFDDARSASSFALFLSDELKASLKRLPGETLRRLPLESVGTSNVMLDRVPGLGIFSLWFDSVPFKLGPLTAESTSAWAASVSGASTEFVLKRGEERV